MISRTLLLLFLSSCTGISQTAGQWILSSTPTASATTFAASASSTPTASATTFATSVSSTPTASATTFATSASSTSTASATTFAASASSTPTASATTFATSASSTNQTGSPVFNITYQTDTAVCVCDCLDVYVWNISHVELRLLTRDIRRGLSLDFQALSNRVRGKNSASDDRVSARSMGYTGALVIGVAITILVLIDINNIWSSLNLVSQQR